MSNQVITLLSDLGSSNTSAAMVKSVLMNYAGEAVIVDITHDIARDDLQEAAYVLHAAYGYFPSGTVHVLAVDVFAGEAPCILMAGKGGHFFIAPDNGVLPLVFGFDTPVVQLCYECKRPYHFSEWVHNAGSIIDSILRGNKNHFQPYAVTVSPRVLQPMVTADCIDCNILYIDRYENVVLNISRQKFETAIGNQRFCIRVLHHADVTTVSNNYNDVPEDEPLARFNDAGYLEIASNHGSAKTLLGLEEEGNISKLVKIFLAPR